MKAFFKPTKSKVIITIAVSVIGGYILYKILSDCGPCPNFDDPNYVFHCGVCAPVDLGVFLYKFLLLTIIGYFLACSLSFVAKQLRGQSK